MGRVAGLVVLVQLVVFGATVSLLKSDPTGVWEVSSDSIHDTINITASGQFGTFKVQAGARRGTLQDRRDGTGNVYTLLYVP